jgi:hypothetical protein
MGIYYDRNAFKIGSCLTVLGSGYNQNKTMNKAFDNYENLKKITFALHKFLLLPLQAAC